MTGTRLELKVAPRRGRGVVIDNRDKITNDMIFSDPGALVNLEDHDAGTNIG